MENVYMNLNKNSLNKIIKVIVWWRRSRPAESAVVAAIYKYTWTTEILWRKRDGMATLSRGERLWVPWPLPQEESTLTLALTGFYCFLGPLHQRWSSFTMHRFVLGGYLLQTKERVLLITSKKKDICKCKGKSGWTGYTLSLEGLA